MILGIIPARWASSRFPGKPLIDIAGKSMIQRVYEQAMKTVESGALQKIVVATDDERIRAHVATFGGEAVMTAADHPSGTDRCYEALQLAGGGYRYVINIQGDEPFLHPAQIEELAAALADGEVAIATQMIPVSDGAMLTDPGEVKIVLNEQNEALYFSRSPIPFLKNVPQAEWHLHHRYFRHVGLYAYRGDVLRRIADLKPTALEAAESLEQLRWLEAGYKIKCIPTAFESHCIDTPEDLQRALARMPY